MDVPPQAAQAGPSLCSQLMQSSRLREYEVHHESLRQPKTTCNHSTNNTTIGVVRASTSFRATYAAMLLLILLLPPLLPRMRARGRNADVQTPLALTYPGLSHCRSH